MRIFLLGGGMAGGSSGRRIAWLLGFGIIGISGRSAWETYHSISHSLVNDPFLSVDMSILVLSP